MTNKTFIKHFIICNYKIFKQSARSLKEFRNKHNISNSGDVLDIALLNRHPQAFKGKRFFDLLHLFSYALTSIAF